MNNEKLQELLDGVTKELNSLFAEKVNFEEVNFSGIFYSEATYSEDGKPLNDWRHLISKGINPKGFIQVYSGYCLRLDSEEYSAKEAIKIYMDIVEMKLVFLMDSDTKMKDYQIFWRAKPTIYIDKDFDSDTTWYGFRCRPSIRKIEAAK